MNNGYFYTLDRPLHVLPSQSQVRITNLQQFPELITRLGGDHRSILERYDIDPTLTQNPDGFLDCQDFVNMYEYCASKLNDPLFGFHLAHLQAPGVYGCVTELCRSASTLRDAINCLIEYIPVLHSTESVLELVENDNIAELRWSERSNLGINYQASCQGLLLNLKVLRTVAGPAFKPSYITLPPDILRNMTREIENVIGCAVRKSVDKGLIAFPAHDLNMKISSANPALFQLLSGYMLQLKQSPKQSIVDKVNHYIASDLSSGCASIEDCSSKLGVSTRTLQLKLKQSNMRFSDMLEQQRLARAKQVLKHSNTSISEIADMLGYCERTSFGRAFKRWTGMSPQQYREH